MARTYLLAVAMLWSTRLQCTPFKIVYVSDTYVEGVEGGGYNATSSGGTLTDTLHRLLPDLLVYAGDVFGGKDLAYSLSMRVLFRIGAETPSFPRAANRSRSTPWAHGPQMLRFASAIDRGLASASSSYDMVDILASSATHAAGRAWLFDVGPFNSSSHEGKLDTTALLPTLQELSRSLARENAEVDLTAMLHCVPSLSAKAVLHLPLLEHAYASLDWLNQTEGDILIARACGEPALHHFCSVWEGIQLCVMDSSAYVLPVHQHAWRRNIRVFELRSACVAGKAVCEILRSSADGYEGKTLPVVPCVCAE